MHGYCFGRIGRRPPKSAKMVGKILDLEVWGPQRIFAAKKAVLAGLFFQIKAILPSRPWL
jgi:hypothetical protein